MSTGERGREGEGHNHLERRDDGRLEVVGLGRLRVQDVDGVAAPRDVEDRRVVEVARELGRVERRR